MTASSLNCDLPWAQLRDLPQPAAAGRIFEGGPILSLSALKRLEMDDGGEQRTNDFSLLCNREFSRVCVYKHCHKMYRVIWVKQLTIRDAMNT